MKTFIINGSSGKNGGTASIIPQLQKNLYGEVTIINTYHTNISPCIDCRYCWENSNCAINVDL